LFALMLFVTMLVIAGCGGGGQPVSQIAPTGAASTNADEAAATQPAAPFLGEAVATIVPPATDTPAATATPAASPTPAATPTAEGGVVAFATAEFAIDPDATPAPFDDVAQSPYAESDCSDKYPCNEDIEGWESRIRLPEGFEASYFARVDGQPNVLTFGPNGLLYVGTMAGEIFTVDQNGEPSLYVTAFNAPAGLAFQAGTERLYVASRVGDQNEGGEARVAVVEDGVVTDLITGLPCCYVAMHSANGIAFGPDGYGYVAVGG